MRSAPIIFFTIALTVLFLSFQNCSSANLKKTSEADSAEVYLTRVQSKIDPRPPQGSMQIWTLGQPDQLVQPSLRGDLKLWGENSNARFLEAYKVIRSFCGKVASDLHPINQIVFSIRSEASGSEGQYLLDCQAHTAARQPAADDSGVVHLEKETGKVIVRYPGLLPDSAPAETAKLFQVDNEFRFLTAKTVAQEHCERVLPTRHVVQKVEFQVETSRGVEGTYRIDCKRAEDQRVAFRTLKK